jgi:hypothetical protein
MKHSIFLLVLCLTFLGCGGQSVPEGFPKKLAPVTVTLTQDGNPLTGTALSLVTEQSSPYSVSANTAADGTVKFETAINAYTKPGVPPGTYKMTASVLMRLTTPNPAFGASDAELKEYEAKSGAERAELRKKNPVPPNWSDPAKTPLRLTISGKGGDFKIEIDDPGTFVQ